MSMREKPTALAPLAEGTEFELLGSEDGTIFALRFKTDQLVAHLQGEDATRFRADYDAIRLQFPAWNPDQTLAQLWDQGGYSWLAGQDG
jgi:hypothetical protein